MFNMKKILHYFESQGWCLVNKKLDIIFISLPQDSVLFVPLCLTNFNVLLR